MAARPKPAAQLKPKPLEIEKTFITRILDNEFTCSICFEIFNKPSKLECGHIFCTKCLNNWLRNSRSCPICRKCTKGTPVKCEYIEKIISEMTSEQIKISRRRTIDFSDYESQTVRRNNKKENKRPPWRF